MKRNGKMKLIGMSICMLICCAGYAQLNISLSLNSRPTAYLSDWNSALTGQLIVTNTSGSAIPVKIYTQLLQNGSVIATNNPTQSPLVTISALSVVLRMDKIIQLPFLAFSTMSNLMTQSGKLPAGDYSLKVQLFDASGLNPVTEIQERPFTIINYQLPFLLSPAENAVLQTASAQTAITFRWSNLVPVTQEFFKYRLQVFEIKEHQTDLQALRGNMPILTKDLVRTTQYIWQPQLYLNDSSMHRFIWTIQTLDENEQPVNSLETAAQGFSEPRTFTIAQVTGHKEQ